MIGMCLQIGSQVQAFPKLLEEMGGTVTGPKVRVDTGDTWRYSSTWCLAKRR